MYGIVTRNPDELTWDEFDLTFFEVKGVNGRVTQPEAGHISVISCFGDTARSVADPDLVPVDDAGSPANREHARFDWGYICPTREDYREELLDFIEEVAGVTPNIRIDEIGFPDEGYCRCATCQTRFAESTIPTWQEWRQHIIVDFVRAVRKRVSGKLYITLYPDPYPGHLARRMGVDIERIEPLVDEFVIPLYDQAYSSPYWVETLATGFASRLSTPFSVELFASDSSIDSLVSVSEILEPVASSVVYGYDGAQARATVRRIRANEHAGTTHYPDR